MENKIRVVFVCMLVLIALLPATAAVNVQNALPAASDLIGIKIVAKVTKISDSYNLLGGTIQVNDTITGKYIYNSRAPDIEPDPNSGVYMSTTAPCGIELKTGEYLFKTDTSDIDLAIVILNDAAPPGYPPIDSYVVASLNNLPVSNGMLVTYIQWSLDDNTATALSSADLPTTAPVLDAWNDRNSLFIDGKSPSNPSHTCRISAEVTKATKNNLGDTPGAVHTPSLSLTIPHAASHSPFMQFWCSVFQRYPLIFPVLRSLFGF